MYVLPRFSRIGSLYFKDSGIPGCETIAATEMPTETADSITSRFAIGPMVRREFWEKERANMHTHHGPRMAFDTFI